MKPIFSWAGSKRRLVKKILKYLPLHNLARGRHKWIEPFCGGASLFFDIEPYDARLIDKNEELINAYRGIKLYPHETYEELEKQKPTKEYYYKLREVNPSDLEYYEVAARMIYLLKSSFSSLYRVNKDGIFNVPWGKKIRKVPIYSLTEILNWSRVLKRSWLMNGDFSIIVDLVGKGDIVYFDPPYYKEEAFYKFAIKDHERLSRIFKYCNRKGAIVALSIGSATEILDYYDQFQIVELNVYQGVAKNPKHRKYRQEYLVIGY